MEIIKKIRKEFIEFEKSFQGDVMKQKKINETHLSFPDDRINRIRSSKPETSLQYRLSRVGQHNHGS